MYKVFIQMIALTCWYDTPHSNVCNLVDRNLTYLNYFASNRTIALSILYFMTREPELLILI